MEHDIRANADVLKEPGAFHPPSLFSDHMEIGLGQQHADFERLATFLDKYPDPMLRIMRDGSVAYANHPGRELLRYWEAHYREVGLPSPAGLVEIVLETGSHPQHELEIDGKVCLLGCVPNAELDSAFVYCRNVTERRRVSDALQRRDAILQVVAFAAERFLGTGIWQAHIDEVLERLGHATVASRLYIYENRPGADGERLIAFRHQWTASGIAPLDATAQEQPVSLRSAGLERWEQMLAQGYIISGAVDSFTGIERTLLARRSVRSVLAIPIFVGDHWWGTFGMDECVVDRVCEPCEVEALKAATRILGSAIQRTLAQEDLQHQKEFTRLVIDTDPNLIYVKEASGRFILANQATADLYDISSEEIVGLSNWHIHSVPEEVMSYQQSDREVLQLRREIAVREQYTRADGRVQWFETIKKPLVQPDGVVHVLGISTDITERRHAELVLRNREQQQQAVVQLGLHALAGEPLAALMERVMATVRDMLGLDFVAIWQVDAGGSQLRMRAGIGWSEECVGTATLGLGTESQAGFVLRIKAPVIVSDWEAEGRFARPEILAGHGIRGSMNVLIHGKTQPFGVMSAHAVVARDFTEDDINFLQAVANVLAYAIEWKQGAEALRESEERYRIVAETATDAILTVDQDNRIIFANHSTQGVFGYAAPEILWQDLGLLLDVPIEEIHRIAHQKTEDRFMDARANGNSVALQGRHRNGTALPLEVSVGEFIKNGRHFFTCIIRDVTERKRAEEDINQLNEELRQANELLTIERDREKEHVAVLEELNLMKSEFVSSVSHELRTPLASIIGFAQTIMIDPDLPAEMRQEFTQIILEEGKRLAKLINDLLDLARIESGRVVLENCEGDVVSLVKRAVQSIAMQADAKAIDVSVVFDDDEIVAVFDHDRMLQVLINLLSNAVKFTPAGGRIGVHARVEGGDIVIDVSDTGLGIPAEDIPKLFEKFFRVHRPGMDIRGTGLGLAIARHAVELQGGTLTVQSEENRGSIFTIRFPQR